MAEFEQTLLEVWRQALIENAKYVRVGGQPYPMRRISGLRMVQFVFEAGKCAGWSRIQPRVRDGQPRLDKGQK